MGRLPEYEAAVTVLSWQLIPHLFEACDPLLAAIGHKAGPVSTSLVPSSAAKGFVHPIGVEVTLSEPIQSVVDCDVDTWAAMVYGGAQKALPNVMAQFFAGMTAACERAGTVIDAQGRQFDRDMWLDLLESYELSFDERGEPVMPALVAGPKLVERIQGLPPPTPAQDARLADILQRKRAEFDARRRIRKLG